MAESNSGQEKTEQPTQKRLADSRKKGETARSRELNTTLGLIVSASALIVVGPYMLHDLIAVLENSLKIEREFMFDKTALVTHFFTRLFDALAAISPFLLIMLLASFVGPLVMGGWVFSLKSMAFKFSKINPLSGLKRMFGTNGLVEMVKSLAKFLLLGAAATLLFRAFIDEYIYLSLEPLNTGLAHGSWLLLWQFLGLSAVLILVSGIDVPYQLFSHKKKLKMTRQEVKQENKDTEGSAEVKGRVRAIQREMAQRRMLEDVPEAAVVIVNPTHFAVALKYEDETSDAPILVAKGTDNLAFKIREVAQANSVPIFSAPPLSRGLYYSTEIGQPIPTGLYIAVAKILAYIHQLQQATKTGRLSPDSPDDLEIPEVFTKLAQKNTRFER